MNLDALGDADDVNETLLHEFAHLLTLNATQVPPDPSLVSDDDEVYYRAERACAPRYFAGNGCALEGTYMDRFTQAFWAGQSGEADPDPTRFVTDYAASDPAEDLAETFTAYVLADSLPTGDSVADQKVRFFAQFPELVALRDTIRGRLGR